MSLWGAGVNFWIGAALLCVAAVSFVLAPFFLRLAGRVNRQNVIVDLAKTRLAEIENDFQSGTITADEYHQLKLDQQRRLLQEADPQVVSGQASDPLAPAHNSSRVLLIAFALLVPIFAGAFYFYSGAWTDWRIQQLLEQSARDAQSGNENIEVLEHLRTALKYSLAKREDKEGRKRFMLAQLEMEFRNYSSAAEEFGVIQKKFPDNATIAAQYAQALYLARDRQLTPEVLAQAERALQLDPNQTTALGLLGIAAFERQDFAKAVTHWRHLLRLLPPAAASRAMIEQGIKQAEQQLGPDGLPGPKFVVSVSLSNDLIKSQPIGGTLFVFAKAVDGPPMPLAAARFDPSQLPIEVTLDNSMAMAPGLDLSSAKQVQIFARITASGQVRGEAGDLEGSSESLTVSDKAQKVVLKIDRKL